MLDFTRLEGAYILMTYKILYTINKNRAPSGAKGPSLRPTRKYNIALYLEFYMVYINMSCCWYLD